MQDIYSYLHGCQCVFVDMDGTLIRSDCDVTWKIFLRKKRIAPWYSRLFSHWHYFRYSIGKLNLQSFFHFQLQEITGQTILSVAKWSTEHCERYAIPQLYANTVAFIAMLKDTNRPVVLLTSTAQPLAEPLARHLALSGCIGTPLEIDNGRYTGKIVEPYCGGVGKLHYIQTYIRQNLPNHATDSDWSAICYCGDSINDIPIIKKVGYPIACNPDKGLSAYAKKHRIPILCL